MSAPVSYKSRISMLYFRELKKVGQTEARGFSLEYGCDRGILGSRSLIPIWLSGNYVLFPEQTSKGNAVN